MENQEIVTENNQSADVQDVNAQLTNEQNENAQDGSQRKLLYNILTMCICIVMLVMQVYGFALMAFGGVSLDGTVANVIGAVGSVRLIIDTSARFLMSMLPKLMFVASVAIAGIVIAIILLVKLIKSIILIFRFFSLGKSYEEQNKNFKAFKKTSYKSLSTVFQFLLACYILGFEVTTGSIVFLVLTGIVVLAETVFDTLFIEGSFKFNIKETLFALIEKLVTVFIAVMLICAINAGKSSFYAVIKKMFSAIMTGITFVTSAQKIAWICEGFVMPFLWLIVNMFLMAIGITLLFRSSVVKQKKVTPEQLNGQGSRVAVITALVFTLICFVAACIVSTIGSGSSFGNYMSILGEFIAAILALVASIVLNPLASIMAELKADYVKLLK